MMMIDKTDRYCQCQLLSRVQLFETPWTVARQSPLSMDFSRQEYWSGLPFPSPGHLPDLGTECRVSCIVGRFFTVQATREALFMFIQELFLIYCRAFFREGNCTPLQYSCLENPMDRGAWQEAVHGVAKSRTRLSDFLFTFHFHALEKEMATHSRVLAWRILGAGEPGGLPFMGSHRVGHD